MRKDDPPITKEAYLLAMEIAKDIKPERSIEQNVVRQVQGDTWALGPDPAGYTPAPRSPYTGVKETLTHEMNAIRSAWNGLKIGEGHLKAMFKLGAHELTQALAAFPDSNIRPMEEPGVAFNETMPHIVDEATYDQQLQEYASRSTSSPDQTRSR